MKTKKLFFYLIATFFTVSLFSSSAMAGSKQRHRWEGVAIGVGAALLGHAIFQAHRNDPPPQVVYGEPGPFVGHHPGHGHRHGHWQWQDIWVPPTTERVWNPGHYDKRGRWVKGHWMEVIARDGYWTRERIWIASNRGHHPH